MSVAIIDTGCANIFSVQAALDRLSADHKLARTPDDARNASHLILPGVGTPRAAMRALDSRGWATALPTERRPLLGICLGMQLLFEHSGEGDVAGLGLLPGSVRRLDPGGNLVWPHMGWNQLQIRGAKSPLLGGIADNSHAYFVHGYAVSVSDSTIATTRYGRDFSAIVQRGNIMGCQFHPERSSSVGSKILSNFMEISYETLPRN